MTAERQAIRKTLSQGAARDGFLNQIAGEWESHRFLGKATQGCYVRLVRALELICRQRGLNPSEARLLDWGAGKGHINYLLTNAGFDVISADVNQEAPDSSFGQQTPIIAAKQIKIVALEHEWELPFGDDSFDVVVSFGVLEHVPNDELSLQEIRRVLKPGGIFFFAFLPYWLSWSQRLAHFRGDWYHPRLYRTSDLRRMAARAEFEVGSIWHGQLLPKNSAPNSNLIERADRFLTNHTPLKYLATNLEGYLIAN